MDSALGPVLANLLMGFYEKRHEKFKYNKFYLSLSICTIKIYEQ